MLERSFTGPSGQTYTETHDVFGVLFDDPAQAAEARARAVLLEDIRGEISRRGWTQRQAARHLSTSQAQVSALMRGLLGGISLDRLVRYAEALGGTVTVHVERAQQANLRTAWVGLLEHDKSEAFSVFYQHLTQAEDTSGVARSVSDALRWERASSHIGERRSISGESSASTPASSVTTAYELA